MKKFDSPNLELLVAPICMYTYVSWEKHYPGEIIAIKTRNIAHYYVNQLALQSPDLTTTRKYAYYFYITEFVYSLLDLSFAKSCGLVSHSFNLLSAISTSD